MFIPLWAIIILSVIVIGIPVTAKILWMKAPEDPDLGVLTPIAVVVTAMVIGFLSLTWWIWVWVWLLAEANERLNIMLL